MLCPDLRAPPTRNTRPQRHKGDRVDAVFKIDKATEVSRDVAYNGRVPPDKQNADCKSWVASPDSCGWDESKDKFPWQSEEVHDVVAAGRHLLLALFALLVLLSLNGEGISELVQPGAGSNHHGVARLL